MKIESKILESRSFGAGDVVVTSDGLVFILVEDSYKSYAVNTRNGYIESEVNGDFEDLIEAIVVNYGSIVNHVPSDDLMIVDTRK